jgi:cholesterol transport system auxiliary component
MRLAPVLVALLGCTIGPSQNLIEHTYALNPALPPEKLPQSAPSGTLLVSLPKAEPGFDTARMVYSRRPHEISYYAVNRWIDTPPRMLMGPLMHTLERSGRWRSVVQMPVTIRPDFRLDSGNLVLEHQFYSNSSHVRLALRAQIIDLKLQTVVGSRDFELFEPATTDDPYGCVIASNRAAGKLLEEIAEWIDLTIEERVRNSR